MPISPKEVLKETQAIVKKDFGLTIDQRTYSESELTDLLAEAIFKLIQKNLEQLFSILYRLDVNEEKVHLALAPNAQAPPNLLIAQLIIEREKQKAESRLRYRHEEEPDDEVSPW